MYKHLFKLVRGTILLFVLEQAVHTFSEINLFKKKKILCCIRSVNVNKSTHGERGSEKVFALSWCLTLSIVLTKFWCWTYELTSFACLALHQMWMCCYCLWIRKKWHADWEPATCLTPCNPTHLVNVTDTRHAAVQIPSLCESRNLTTAFRNLHRLSLFRFRRLPNTPSLPCPYDPF